MQRKMRTTDIRRIRALIIDHLNNLEQFGHCFDEAESIEKQLSTYPLFYNMGDDYKIPDRYLFELDEEQTKHLSEKLEIVDHADKKYFYLEELYLAEAKISQFINTLLERSDYDQEYTNFSKYMAASCQKLSSKLRDRFDEHSFISERKKLYEQIFRKSFYVLAGSPGSGKSHELLNIIKELDAQNEKYLLLAPTGKATLRLSTDPEYKGIKTKTIDKFLTDVENEKDRPDSYNNLIVDEMSMVDLLKFRDLIKLFNPKNPLFKRLILVGDKYQLPPIGFGKVFIDIIAQLNSMPDYENNIVELESNCRQESDNSVLEFSKIYSGENMNYEDLLLSASKGELDKGRFKILFWNNNAQLIELIKHQLLMIGEFDSDIYENLNSFLGLNPDIKIDFDNPNHFKTDKFQILTPYRTGMYGTIKINHTIQDKFKSNVPYLSKQRIMFKSGDKLIQNKNLYHKGQLSLSNGSMGIIYENKKKVCVSFSELDNEELSIKNFDLNMLELAFCITIHKAQGSGFDHVILILPKRLTLLSKELFYTALTRSKQTVTLLVEGEPTSEIKNSIFEKIRRRSYTETRKTSLLGIPYWDFSLEPESNTYVQSRAEYIIYRNLMHFREKFGENGFTFYYEKHPIVDGEEINIKTDFTIITDNGHTFYWEHLGKLGNRKYEEQWKWKKEKYDSLKITDMLITTDERRGINDDKIKSIIGDMRKGNLKNEDKVAGRYSKFHYYLR